MSATEEIRRVIREYVDPELREIRSRLDAIETEQRAAFRHGETLTMLSHLQDLGEIGERLARLEAHYGLKPKSAA